MGIRQFCNSLARIQKNPHIATVVGVSRHLLWQIRKVVNAFPFELRISQSRLIAQHKRCGVSALIYNQGMYDWNNMHFLPEIARLANLHTFIDVGANIGVYSLILSEVSRLMVYAFEPHPVTYRYLQKNIEINPGRSIVAVNSAVGNVDGTVYLTDHPGSATNRVLAGGSAEQESGLMVPICRLDTFCSSRNISPEIVKIDVEGYELAVLEGLGELITEIEVLCLELKHQSKEEERRILALLGGAGLEGPFWVRYGQKRLSREQFGFEDPVFCSAKILGVLRNNGWIIEAR